MVVVGGLDSFEQGFRLFPALEEIPEGVLASATSLLGTGALAVPLVVGEGRLLGDEAGEEGVVGGGTDGEVEARGECDGEGSGGDDEDDGIVGEPATEVVVGHRVGNPVQRFFSISDYDTCSRFINLLLMTLCHQPV